MSNYTKTTNFATKDSLPSGNPAKIVKGTEIDTEFNNIAVASATKLNSSTVSAFGATLIDDADASAARTTLGLGTAATTAATDYATAAQGVTADAALPTTGGAMTGAITTNSTFDGRDVATDGTKLDGIEAGATADQTASQIKTAYESNADTNAFTDADHTKLDGIEALADVTDTANVVAALSTGTGISLSAGGEIGNTAPDQTVALTGGGGTTISGAYPNFTITSSSFALPVATSTVLGGVELFSDTEQTVAANTVTATASRTYGIQLNSDDQAVINVPWTDTTYSVGDGGLTEINFTSADNTKLDGIEASADVTDTINVTAAGALMDSEVTNLAQVKAFDSSDYATAAQGTLAAAALPKSGGAMTGAITTNSTFDGRDVATDGTKLDGIEASADVTDTTNVVASLTAGSNITIAADGTIASTSAGGGESLQQTLAIGNTTSTNTRINFRDSGLYIYSSFDGVLDFVADAKLQINAPIFEVNASAEFDGSVVCNSSFNIENNGAAAAVNFGNANNIFSRVQWNSADNSLAMYTNNQERARFPSGGGFLVGKTTTSVTTSGSHISGDGIRSTGTYAGWKGLQLRNTNGVDSAVNLTCSPGIAEIDCTAADAGTGNSLVIKGGTTGEYARFAKSGLSKNLGLGTTAPAEKLHVVGNIVATGNITANYSDERLKDFKGTIPNALNKIAQLNGYYYTPNETALALGVDYTGVEVGVSAQEVEAVLPETIADSVVGKDYKTVMYERLTPLLIEAVKELTQKVEKLELRLDKVEK